jgi:UDP-glucose 4-epimerase
MRSFNEWFDMSDKIRKIKDPKGMILVTGGAGYIGSVTARTLLSSGYNVVVLDNFVKGRRFAVERNRSFAQKTGKSFIFEEGDLGDTEFLKQVFIRNTIEAVIHFAAFIEVSESVERPALYFYNNILNTIHLLDAMAEAGVKRIIFSSSAAVYGNPEEIPIKEDVPTCPINPYGYTKLTMEHMIRHYQKAFGIEWVALRYFNAAGASLDGELGEAHFPESHLIPNAIDMAVRGDKVKVFGNDYATDDGTCLRDFISIVDLAEAHRLALELTGSDLINRPYNLGSEHGFTVGTIVQEVGKTLGLKAEAEYVDRRPGDPDKLVASSEAFQKATGWEPRYSQIKQILQTAAAWHNNRPKEALEPKPLPAADEEKIKEKIKDELDRNRIIPQTLKDEILARLANPPRETHV